MQFEYKIHVISLILSFVFILQFDANSSNDNTQKVLFLDVQDFQTLTFEFPVEHPDFHIRETISVRINLNKIFKENSRCGWDMELKDEMEEWMQKYLQKISHIKIRPSGLDRGFEIVVDGKNLEDTILMKTKAVKEKSDSCIRLTP